MKEKYAKMSDVQKAQEEWLKIFLESGGEGIVLYAMLKMVVDESMGKIPTVELDLEAKEEAPTREAEQGEDQTGRRGMDFGQALGGEARFSFGDAIKYLKRGMKLSRRGWNGKNQHIELAKAISYVSCPNGELVNCNHDAIGNMAIAFVGTSGVQMGWLASQADMLAEDWGFAD